MSAKLSWRGKEVVAQIAARAADAVTEIDQRIETEAKAELYPGHGKRSGTLQRGIQSDPGRVEGTIVRGGVAVRGVAYALRIHRLYEYIVVGLRRVQPLAVDILSRHVKR